MIYHPHNCTDKILVDAMNKPIANAFYFDDEKQVVGIYIKAANSFAVAGNNNSNQGFMAKAWSVIPGAKLVEKKCLHQNRF